MPFHIQVPDAEQAYLNALLLSPAAKALVKELFEEIRDIPDEFRHDPANRPDPDKPCFLVQRMFADFAGDGCFHTIDLYLSDRAAEQGVLIVLYVEHHQGDPIWPGLSPPEPE